MNKHPAGVIDKLKQCDFGELGISTITVSELQYRISKSMHQKKNQNRLEQFMAPFEVLAYDESAAKAYGDIRFYLETKDQSIGPLDVQIAAQALSRNLILVTNNDREFRRIKDLQVENWSD